MRWFLVTSDITYVPKNYEETLRPVWEAFPEEWVGGFLVKSPRSLIMKKLLGLIALGGWDLSMVLLENWIKSWQKKDFQTELLTQTKAPWKSGYSINCPEVKSWLRSLNIDLIVHLRTRCIFDREVLGIPRLGCVNLHHGLLPHQRGTMCDLHALAEARPTGFSLHLMTERVDRGGIFFTRVVKPPGSYPHHYPTYLAISAKEEGNALIEWLTTVKGLQNLPPMLPFIEKPGKFYRTPGIKELWKMRSQIRL